MDKKLELRNIKHSPSLSEETYAYSAKLYVDGKLFAHVTNHGTGGPDMQHVNPPFTHKDLEALEAWVAANFPATDMSQYNMDPMPASLEGWCHDQVTLEIQGRQLKRMLNRTLVTIEDGSLYTYGKGKQTPEWITEVGKKVLAKKPNAVVLNSIPFPEALALFSKQAH